MNRRNPQHGPQPPGELIVVPAGVPSWITAELIQLTLKVFQTRYATPLTLDDAVAMLLNVGRLFGELSRSSQS